MQKVTCGNCQRSWDEDKDPAPSALCHWCHGRGYSTAPLGVELEGMTWHAWTHLTEAERKEARSEAKLTPQLIGLEGARIEVVDCNDEKRRFKVGRSTGWLPIHLELHNRRSRGGPPVTGAPFKSVRIIQQVSF